MWSKLLRVSLTFLKNVLMNFAAKRSYHSVFSLILTFLFNFCSHGISFSFQSGYTQFRYIFIVPKSLGLVFNSVSNNMVFIIIGSRNCQGQDLRSSLQVLKCKHDTNASVDRFKQFEKDCH